MIAVYQMLHDGMAGLDLTLSDLGLKLSHLRK